MAAFFNRVPFLEIEASLNQPFFHLKKLPYEVKSNEYKQ